MNFNKDEIKEVSEIGKLNGAPVKLVKYIGGFNIAVGKKKKDENETILAAGSHPAIVAHQVSKSFGNSFEESMNKNESEQLPSVTEYSHNLNADLYINKGFDIFALKKNHEIEFKITKQNMEICSIKAADIGGVLNIEEYKSTSPLAKNYSKEFSEGLNKSIKDFAESLNLSIKNNLGK